MKKYFAGTLRLIRFILRKERVSSVIWLVILVGISPVVAVTYNNLFSAPEELATMAELCKNPAMIAMFGPIFGDTPAALFAGTMLLYTAVAAGLMNIFLVVRYTRAEEERGRLEVVRSLPVGRLSSLAAVLIFAVIVNLIVALFTGVALGVLSVGGMNWGGAMLYGFSVGVAGLFFAFAAAVFSQVCSGSKSAIGLSLAFLGFLYIVRAAGDISGGALAYIAPLGAILRTQCFAGNKAWPMFLVLGIGALLAGLAFYLNAVRDMDRGLIAERRGRSDASKHLNSPLALAWRLLRNTAVAWLVGVIVLGAAYGSVMSNMEDFIASNSYLNNILESTQGYSQTDMFVAMLISLMAILASVPSSGAMLRLAGEENHSRIENVLSKAVPRQKMLTAYLIIALIESVVMLFGAVLGLWLSAAAVMDSPMALGPILGATAAYLPAVLFMVGLSVLLCGVLPAKASVIIYAYSGVSFALIYLGALLNLPEFTKYLSPFGYIPKLLIGDKGAVAVILPIVIAAIAVAFTAGGYVMYKKRDLR